MHFLILFEFAIPKTNENNMYNIEAIDCSAYGEYMIEAPIATAWWPNTIGKYDSISWAFTFSLMLKA